MKSAVFIMALIALLISGGELAQGAFQETGTVEEIFGMQVSPEGVTFQVFSGGCTTKDSFRIQRFQSDPIQLLLIRKEPDHCEAYIPYGTTVQYSYEALELVNGQRFIVLNPRAPIRVVRSTST